MLHAFDLDPYERPPSEHGYAPLSAVRLLESLGVPRRVALTIRAEQLPAALAYYARRRAFTVDAVRKAARQ